ncbi:MAG TPA: tRNA pseudouridine(38-40) synthase TruA [Fimbriimonadaceae bacterium]|nr:tRNA pseudouridine(38-40) synthase TruA [Fimbriimonadaceae bacterium]
MTRRIKFVVQYDGTDFRGWAAQSGQRTVQSTLTETVRKVSGEDVEITGASRTDSGAHARMQVCHFDSSVGIEPANWSKALNPVLPKDLAVLSSRQVPLSFDSRFSAESRWYRYRIANGNRRPLEMRYAHHEWRTLDVTRMQLASEMLVGKHDFRAFTEELDPWIDNTTRRLYSVEVRDRGSEVWIDIVGTAFLRGMMRRISGCLMEIGLGKRPMSDIETMFLNPSDPGIHLPTVLPAKGLTLMKVKYGKKRDNRATSFNNDF